jgi:hypothetical protein
LSAPDDAVRFAGAAAHQGLGRWRVVS